MVAEPDRTGWHPTSRTAGYVAIVPTEGASVREGRSSWAAEVVDQMAALHGDRQAVLALRYFARLSESQVSNRTGLSSADVRSATAAGLVELGRLLLRSGSSS